MPRAGGKGTSSVRGPHPAGPLESRGGRVLVTGVESEAQVGGGPAVNRAGELRLRCRESLPRRRDVSGP